MRRVNSEDQDRLEYKPGVAARFPFVFAALLVPFYLARSGSTTGGRPPLAIIIALMLTIIFFIVVFGPGRPGNVFDRKSRTVTNWWGLLTRFKSTVRHLSEFAAVTISREERHHKGGTHSVYPVRLQGVAKLNLDIDILSNERDARRMAEQIASFISFSIIDLTTGKNILREAATLNESLREQLARTKQTIIIEAPPAEMRSTFTAAGDRVTFVIPPEKFDSEFFFPMLILVGVLFGVGIGILFGQGTPKQFPGRWILVAILGTFFFVVPIVWLVVYVLSKRSLGGTAEATPDELRVTCKQLIGFRTITIPSAELQDLRIETLPTRRMAPARHLLEAGSKKEYVLFAYGLPRQELEWIRAVILKAVTK